MNWTAVTGATSYNVERGTASGGPYTSIATPAATTYTDTGVTAGSAYYYVVAAVNSAGTGALSKEASVSVPAPSQNVQINVDALSDRHSISPLVYGVDFPPSAAYVSASGTTFVRWGGNASTRYNWKNFYANSAADWYFQDNTFNALGLNTSGQGADSVQFVSDVVGAGANVVTTIPMLSWVARGGPQYYSFSVAKYGAQCKTNPYLADDGDGLQTDCKTPVTGNDPNDANVPLLDVPGSNDPSGSVYRSQWVAALAPAFGSTPHFYDLDNEPDIWSGTHRDVHPNPVTYSELLSDAVKEGGNVKGWDKQAVTFAPVSCCWYYYWNSAAGGNDKAAHGNLDFWPWWLNDMVWEGKLAGQPLVNVFDFHAYPELNSTTGLTAAQVDAMALPSTRGWWDTSYPSQGWIGQNNVTSMQPLPTHEARLVRAIAMVNGISPGLPLSVTEWNFGLTGEDPLPVALTDAEAWGLLGQYQIYSAARWTAPDASTPSYQALELFRNYDGQHSSFAPISVSATNDCGSFSSNPYDCSTFAAVDANGSRMTLLVVNKSGNQLNATLNLSNFTATQATPYTLSTANSAQIQAGTAAPFSNSMTFPPMSATLVVLTGSMSKTPATEWALEPPVTGTSDANAGIVMANSGTTVNVYPSLTGGSAGTVTLSGVTADAGITATISQASLSAQQGGTVGLTVAAGTQPGFYHFQVTGADSSGVTTTQDGLVEVGNPPATLTASGDLQSAPAGANLTLGVSVNPGSSGATASGIDVLFSTSAGTLAASSGETVVGQSADGSKIIVTSGGTGAATVVLTLPATAGTVNVQAEGPYPVGHPVYSFTETAQ